MFQKITLFSLSAFLVLVISIAACSFISTPSPTPKNPGDYIGHLISLSEGELNIAGVTSARKKLQKSIEDFQDRYPVSVRQIGTKLAAPNPLQFTAEVPLSSLPDIIDTDIIYCPQLAEENQLQSYIVANHANISPIHRDTHGLWYAIYFGVVVFEVNPAYLHRLPEDWEDLLSSEYHGKIALGDEPDSDLAYQAIVSAALGNNGSYDNIYPGVLFFQNLQTTGNLVKQIATPETIRNGNTPLVIQWDYTALTHRETNPDLEIILPKSRSVVGARAHIIPYNAPHPYSARLWMEYITSDEGQLTLMQNHFHPIRYNALYKRSAIPGDILQQFSYEERLPLAVIPTPQQQLNAKIFFEKHASGIFSQP